MFPGLFFCRAWEACHMGPHLLWGFRKACKLSRVPVTVRTDVLDYEIIRVSRSLVAPGLSLSLSLSLPGMRGDQVPLASCPPLAYLLARRLGLGAASPLPPARQRYAKVSSCLKVRRGHRSATWQGEQSPEAKSDREISCLCGSPVPCKSCAVLGSRQRNANGKGGVK